MLNCIATEGLYPAWNTQTSLPCRPTPCQTPSSPDSLPRGAGCWLRRRVGCVSAHRHGVVVEDAAALEVHHRARPVRPQVHLQHSRQNPVKQDDGCRAGLSMHTGSSMHMHLIDQASGPRHQLKRSSDPGTGFLRVTLLLRHRRLRCGRQLACLTHCAHAAHKQEMHARQQCVPAAAAVHRSCTLAITQLCWVCGADTTLCVLGKPI